MSSTVTAVALSDDSEHVVANVGDSRSYLLRDDKLVQLTRDESLVQELVDGGHIAPEAARAHPQRSVVLRALDGSQNLMPAKRTLEALAGDRLLLCSDGLTDYVGDGVIESGLHEENPLTATERLVDLALDAGSRDNVSVVVADVVAQRDSSWTWRRLTA